MKIGQRQPPVSLFAMATVLIHCVVSTNQINKLTATSDLPDGFAVGVVGVLHGLLETCSAGVGVAAGGVNDALGADEYLAGGERPRTSSSHSPADESPVPTCDRIGR
jgi:hypothetical protein